MLLDLHPNMIILSHSLKDFVLASIKNRGNAKVLRLNLRGLSYGVTRNLEIYNTQWGGIPNSVNNIANIQHAIELLEGMCLSGADEVKIELWFKIFCEKLERELQTSGSDHTFNIVVFIIENLDERTKEDQERVFKLFDSLLRMLYGHVNHPIPEAKKLFSEYLVIFDDQFLDLGNPVTYKSFHRYTH